MYLEIKDCKNLRKGNVLAYQKETVIPTRESFEVCQVVFVSDLNLDGIVVVQQL
jgi:hypothetical protein